MTACRLATRTNSAIAWPTQPQAWSNGVAVIPREGECLAAAEDDRKLRFSAMVASTILILQSSRLSFVGQTHVSNYA